MIFCICCLLFYYLLPSILVSAAFQYNIQYNASCVAAIKHSYGDALTLRSDASLTPAAAAVNVPAAAAAAAAVNVAPVHVAPAAECCCCCFLLVNVAAAACCC